MLLIKNDIARPILYPRSAAEFKSKGAALKAQQPAARSGEVLTLEQAIAIAPLHGDPRFSSLLRRMGLTEATAAT